MVSRFQVHQGRVLPRKSSLAGIARNCKKRYDPVNIYIYVCVFVHGSHESNELHAAFSKRMLFTVCIREANPATMTRATHFCRRTAAHAVHGLALPCSARQQAIRRVKSQVCEPDFGLFHGCFADVSSCWAANSSWLWVKTNGTILG